MRINKYLAHKGFSTRRGADELIENKKVFINDTLAKIGQKVEEGDQVEVRNAPKKEYRYVAYYKPRGVITHSPNETETDIVTRIVKDYGLNGVFPIGRIDKDSEGLILLSDDGRITERILNPDNAHEKEYTVHTDKPLRAQFKNLMESGINIEGYTTKECQVEILSKQMFKIILTEGKKHQIRRMCAALGYQVTRLKRIRVLNIKIDNMTSSQIRMIKGAELKELLTTLGL